MTLAFPDVKAEAYRRSVLHLKLNSAVEGSVLNWCEQNMVRELMSEDLICAKIAEPDMTAVNFNDHSVTEWAKWIEGISKGSQNSGF